MAKTSATNQQLPAPQKGARWIPIKRGDGAITGHIECFRTNSPWGVRWVSVPGASRWLDPGASEPRAIEE